MRVKAFDCQILPITLEHDAPWLATGWVALGIP